MLRLLLSLVLILALYVPQNGYAISKFIGVPVTGAKPDNVEAITIPSLNGKPYLGAEGAVHTVVHICSSVEKEILRGCENFRKMVTPKSCPGVNLIPLTDPTLKDIEAAMKKAPANSIALWDGHGLNYRQNPDKEESRDNPVVHQLPVLPGFGSTSAVVSNGDVKASFLHTSDLKRAVFEGNASSSLWLSTCFSGAGVCAADRCSGASCQGNERAWSDPKLGNTDRAQYSIIKLLCDPELYRKVAGADRIVSTPELKAYFKREFSDNAIRFHAEVSPTGEELHQTPTLNNFAIRPGRFYPHIVDPN